MERALLLDTGKYKTSLSRASAFQTMTEEYTSERLQAPWNRRSDCIVCGASNPHDAPCCWKCGGKLENDVEYYGGTDIETVYASEPCSDTRDLAIGIVDEIAGKRFGHYADCGIVHTEEA